MSMVGLSRFLLPGARFVALGSAAVVLALVGCSSDPEPADKYPSVESFCEAKAQTECDQVAAKCAARTEACVVARKFDCQNFVTASKTGTRTYQPKAAESCVSKAGEIFAKNVITPDDTKALAAVCDKVFKGTQAKLQACTSAGDCTGDLICDKGVCADRVEKAKGDFCGNPGEVCDASAYCTQAAAGSLQCAAKKAANETCDAKNPCVDTLRCAGTCADRFPSGGTCDTDADCASGAPFCDLYNGKKCSAGIIPAPGTPACKQLFGGS
ncbi:MAG: hypothetical protein U0235_27225 [Polyangiaceae bacterium]